MNSKPRSSRFRVLLRTSFIALLVGLGSPALAASISVSIPMPADNDAADGVCTLREAIIAANTRKAYHDCPAGDTSTNTISLPAGTYTLKSNLPTVGSNIHIVGSGFARTTIDGNRLGGLIIGGTGVEIDDLSFIHAVASGIHVQSGAVVQITTCNFSDNGTTDSTSGSDIFNEGNTLVFRSNFHSSNVRPFSGFLLNLGVNAQLNINACAIWGNSAEHGIIFNNAGGLSLYNSTVGGNRQHFEGVITNTGGGFLGIGFSTIAFNQADLGRGTAIENVSGRVEIGESLVFGSGTTAGGPTCVGPSITSLDSNVFDSASPCTTLSPSDAVITDPLLDRDASNLPKAHGGNSPIYLPLTGSRLIGWVDASFCESLDQRGVARPVPSNCAAGAADLAEAVILVGNPNVLTNGDRVIIAQAQSVFGANRVQVFGDTWAGTPPSPSVVVLAGSVNDAHVSTRFRNIQEGVLVLKPSLYDEMNMTNSAGTTSEGTSTANSLRVNPTFEISSGSGFTSGGFSSRNDVVVTTANTLFGWGATGGMATVDGIILANANDFGIFHFNTSDTMFHSFAAPGCRIGLFATNSAAPLLNTAGIQLLQQALMAGTRSFSRL